MRSVRHAGTAALERFIHVLPDAPDLTGAERVSAMIGMTDYPCLRRDPTPAPGLVPVGQAALAGPQNPVQRMVFRAATVDPHVARRAYLMAMRANPVTLTRVACAARRC